MPRIRIRYFNDRMERLAYVDGKSDWIDLRAAKDVTMKAGEFQLIPLGIAMELPKGYEAHVVPRSSTYKNFGIIQTNHMGVIDESYCGDNDQWYFPIRRPESSSRFANMESSFRRSTRRMGFWSGLMCLLNCMAGFSE